MRTISEPYLWQQLQGWILYKTEPYLCQQVQGSILYKRKFLSSIIGSDSILERNLWFGRSSQKIRKQIFSLHDALPIWISSNICPGTNDKGIVFNPSKKLVMDCYDDADFSGLGGHEDPQDPICARSRTGFVVILPIVLYFLSKKCLWGQ